MSTALTAPLAPGFGSLDCRGAESYRESPKHLEVEQRKYAWSQCLLHQTSKCTVKRQTKAFNAKWVKSACTNVRDNPMPFLKVFTGRDGSN